MYINRLNSDKTSFVTCKSTPQFAWKNKYLNSKYVVLESLVFCSACRISMVPVHIVKIVMNVLNLLLTAACQSDVSRNLIAIFMLSSAFKMLKCFRL